MTIHHVIKLGFLHSTQSRKENEPYNKQDNRKVQEVNEPNSKAVCGRAVEMSPQSGLAQLSALPAAYV